MPRNSRRASEAGIAEANRALKEKVWTKKQLEIEVGCGTNTISNFFSRKKKIENHFFVGICNALDLDVKEVEDLSEDNETDYYHPFQTIIDDKTKDFVGREYVFDAIAEFINSNPKGYFTIKGDPGMGKSAILAKYVQNTECIAHFNVENEGLNRADQFIESVCKQLIEKYQLTDSLPLSAEAKQDGFFLKKLLDEVALKRNNKPVVIAVDALDEVDLSQHKKTTNILYLPRYLPKGIYFITTIRRGVEVPLMTEPPQQIFNLMDYQDQSREDVCNYIGNRVNGSEQLRQWIKAQEVTQKKFIAEIATRSENNFMYLFYVLLGIEDDIYPDLSLDSLPQGLQQYYQFHWQKMEMNADPPPLTKYRIVYMISETPIPIPYDEIVEIIKYTGEQEAEFTVQYVLKKWNQFLHKINLYNQTSYRYYHNDYRRFLHLQDEVQAAGKRVNEIKTLMANKTWQDLYG